MLTWNVYYEDFNARKIKSFNIFSGNFLKDCQETYKKYKDDKENFIRSIKSNLMYYYWSKCEWEILITTWIHPEEFESKKIDVYDQIVLNWNVFIEYVWNNRKELKISKG